MRRRGPLFVVVLIGLACLSAAGCRTAATVAAPLTDTGKIDSGLPLRVAWLANLQPPEKEDLPHINQFQSQARQVAVATGRFHKEPQPSPKILKAVSDLQAGLTADPEHRAIIYSNYHNSIDEDRKSVV